MVSTTHFMMDTVAILYGCAYHYAMKIEYDPEKAVINPLNHDGVTYNYRKDGKMFNLEKFQAEFKAGWFDEFHYYSTLAKELTRMKETVSIAHLSVSRAAQLEITR